MSYRLTFLWLYFIRHILTKTQILKRGDDACQPQAEGDLRDQGKVVMSLEEGSIKDNLVSIFSRGHIRQSQARGSWILEHIKGA